jgi:curved DNA-binding protein CbpA
MSQRDGNNYYEILEVPADAPQAEIHRAYQRAKSTYSESNPAWYSMFTPEEAQELLRLIEEAFAVLSNQATRKSYDENRSGFIPPAQTTSSSARFESPTGGSQSARPATTHAIPMERGAEGKETGFAKKETPAMPPGTGKTALSTYKVDENFDAEIKGALEFDGPYLQKIRLYKNVTIDRLSEATRISRSYLMAVETADYKNLPAAVFVRGFVVQMARNLGLEENKVAASYMKHFKAGGGK